MTDTTNQLDPAGRRQQEELRKLSGFILRFGQRVGADLDPLDETGFSELRCGQLSVGITANPEHDLLLFLVPMEGLPARPGAQFYRSLLALNFTATGPCAFAVDEERRRLYLRILRPLQDLSYLEFERLLQTIATVGQSMQQRINQLAEQERDE